MVAHSDGNSMACKAGLGLSVAPGTFPIRTGDGHQHRRLELLHGGVRDRVLGSLRMAVTEPSFTSGLPTKTSSRSSKCATHCHSMREAAQVGARLRAWAQQSLPKSLDPSVWTRQWCFLRFSYHTYK
eukprot:101325-Amphidinium_carterae.2